jgi:hypothetical protein
MYIALYCVAIYVYVGMDVQYMSVECGVKFSYAVFILIGLLQRLLEVQYIWLCYLIYGCKICRTSILIVCLLDSRYSIYISVVIWELRFHGFKLSIAL